MLLAHPWMERQGWVCDGRRSRFLLIDAAAAALGIAILLFSIAPRFSPERLSGTDQWTPMMQALSKDKGIFAVASGLWLRPQLRTRRGVLLDPCQLNFLAYVPSAASAVERILNRVYGSSLRSQHYDRLFLLVPWERRSLEEWQKIREEFGVTTVVVRDDCPLHLPLTFRSPAGEIYFIPPRVTVVRSLPGHD